MNNLSYESGSVALLFEGLPANCSEAQAADLLWFNVPGGLNVPIENISCKTQSNGLASTCIAVLDAVVIHDFMRRILEQGRSKLKVFEHVTREKRTASARLT